MQSHNISRSQISKILIETPYKGAYGVPCVIHELPLNKTDLCIAVSLFKLEREFRRETNQRDGKFFITIRVLSAQAKCSTDSARRVLARLEYMGLIKYQTGSWAKRRATQIQILLDNFYLADEELEYRKTLDIQKQNQATKTKNNINNQVQQT